MARSKRTASTRTARKRISGSTKRTKKARTYVRYDPTTGQRVKVTKADPRYLAWSNRKPSKRAKLQEKILAAPGEYVKERAKKVAEESLKHVVTGALSARGLAKYGPGAAAALPAVAAAAGSASILGAAYVVADHIARNGQLELGQRVQGISDRFLHTQGLLAKQYGVRSFSQVPADVRAKALADYKRALATAASQAQGTAFAGGRESYK